jgi:hypothetical protein
VAAVIAAGKGDVGGKGVGLAAAGATPGLTEYDRDGALIDLAPGGKAGWIIIATSCDSIQLQKRGSTICRMSFHALFVIRF